MNNEMTQEQMVLEWLRSHKDCGITSHIALEELGIIQLPARIYRLRRRGHIIRTVPFTGRNKFGKEVKFLRYFLEE